MGKPRMITRFTTLGAAVALFTGGAAHAVPFSESGLATGTLGNSSSVLISAQGTNQGNATVIEAIGGGYNATTPAGASWSADQAPIEMVPVTGPSVGDGSSVPLKYLSPFDNTALYGTTYFSIGKDSASPVTLEFTEDQTSFNFLWGSVDDYNELAFLDSDNNEILSIAAAGALGILYDLDLIPIEQDYYGKWLILDFAFADSLAFRKVRFTSEYENGDDRAAMEIAFRSSVSEVPVPAAVWFLLTGIAGLAFAGRSRRTA